MAKRYSGQLIIRIEFHDPTDAYQGSIRSKDGHLHYKFMDLKLSPVMRRKYAVDSPQAYDEAARAILGFASADNEDIYQYAQITGENYPLFHIRRSPRGKVVLIGD